jgi:hypothetical protein
MSAFAPGVVMAPVSPAVARLLHQLQAETIKASDVVAPGCVILASASPPLRCTDNSESGGYRRVVGEAAGRCVRLQTEYLGDPAHPWSRPGVWYGCDARVDSEGVEWERRIDNHVVDDFGQLVPIGGAQ